MFENADIWSHSFHLPCYMKPRVEHLNILFVDIKHESKFMNQHFFYIYVFIYFFKTVQASLHRIFSFLGVNFYDNL